MILIISNCFYRIILVCITLVLLSPTILFSGVSGVVSKFDSLPPVFTMGEYDEEYELLAVECHTGLLELSGASMDQAYAYWLKELGEFEAFAKTEDFDIGGVKIWINFFWNPDGSIRHIVFTPKAESRNIDFSRFQDLLKAYAGFASIDIKTESCFSHSGSASFPTHARYILENKFVFNRLLCELQLFWLYF